MKGIMLRGIVRPLVERLGTMLAAYMIARGLDSDLIAQLINALVAVVFVGLDLVTSAVNRDRDITRFVQEADYSHLAGRLHRREDD